MPITSNRMISKEKQKALKPPLVLTRGGMISVFFFFLIERANYDSIHCDKIIYNQTILIDS